MMTDRQMKRIMKLPAAQRSQAMARIDWTVDPKTGCSNASVEFRRLCDEVEKMIRQDCHSLIAGRADNTARFIVAQLAHCHGVRPKQS